MKPSLMLFPLVIAVVIIAFFFINPQTPAPAQVPTVRIISPADVEVGANIGDPVLFAGATNYTRDGPFRPNENEGITWNLTSTGYCCFIRLQVEQANMENLDIKEVWMYHSDRHDHISYYTDKATVDRYVRCESCLFLNLDENTTAAIQFIIERNTTSTSAAVPSLTLRVLDEDGQYLQVADRVQINTEQLCSGSAQCFTATVTKIVDGDTLDVDYQNTTRIRLALTNTPERGQDGWAEATAFTKQMCPVGSYVVVDEDDGQIEGSYGRMIAKVTCSGGLTFDAQDGKPGLVINSELLEAGHAVISTNFCDESEFAAEAWAEKYGC